MGAGDLSDAHLIRREVFINEQRVPESIELDDTDGDAVHLVLYDNGTPAATGRMRVTDEGLVIGRVAVLKAYRGQGFGDLVMRMLIRRAVEAGFGAQTVHAQITARGFYEKLGFEAYGEEFIEAGIAHISMRHDGDVGCTL
jgi:predicted GNAT family N-acyltransferase